VSVKAISLEITRPQNYTYKDRACVKSLHSVTAE